MSRPPKNGVTTLCLKRKRTTDHVTAYGQARGAEHDRQSGLVQKLVLTIFNIIKPKVEMLTPESRRLFLMTNFSVVQLIEKSESYNLLESIIDGVSDWLPILTNKERSILMLKLYQNLTKRLPEMSTEKHFDREKLDNLQTKYLEVVYNVYQGERSSDVDRGSGMSELISKLEAPYLWGLTHPKTREKFFSLYDDWVPS